MCSRSHKQLAPLSPIPSAPHQPRLTLHDGGRNRWFDAQPRQSGRRRTAARQSIVATKQMQHGRRTSSLKAIYEAIHGPASPMTEFCFRLQPERSTAATSGAAGATSSSHHSHQRDWRRTAASQAIMATKQMQHGRRTIILKAIYEAIHGPAGTTTEFCFRLQPE
ncbi:hypothetical protein KR200_007686 [Drosophila serrata]|nr:hypothetical protein KR200_007686 [Drosophila serrata]